MNAGVRFLFSEGGLVVFLMVSTLWIARRPQSKTARRFLVSGALFYTLISIYAVSFVLTRPLIAGYQPLTAADVPAGRTAVIVLGSGGFTIEDWNNDRYSTADMLVASRVKEAVRVYRMVNPEVVVASGGRLNAKQFNEATGAVGRDLLVQLGVPADRVRAQLTSLDTAEEARLDLELLGPAAIEHFVVVTSDFHMRRTVGTFRALGVNVIPAIARDPEPARRWQDWVIPDSGALWRSSMLAHEVLGIGYYAARGWYRF